MWKNEKNDLYLFYINTDEEQIEVIKEIYIQFQIKILYLKSLSIIHLKNYL